MVFNTKTVTTGTGHDEGDITGHKNKYVEGTTVYAVHTWSELSGGEVLKLIWQKKTDGGWETQFIQTWTNPNYETAWMSGAVTYNVPGDRRVRSYCAGKFGGDDYFTILPEEPEPEPEPEPKEAFVNFITHPDEANLYIDDDYKGKTNLNVKSTPGSKHSYRIEKEGYKTLSGTRTWPSEGTKVAEFTLEEIPPVPPEKPPETPTPPEEGWPEFPADKLPEKARPIWNKMKIAYETKDKDKMMEALREAAITPGSAVILTLILAITGVVSLIIAVVGTYPFSGFIEEEAIQTLDFQITRAIEDERFEDAEKLIDAKEDTAEEILSSGTDFANAIALLINKTWMFPLNLSPLPLGPDTKTIVKVITFLASIPILKELPFFNTLDSLKTYGENAMLALESQRNNLKKAREEAEEEKEKGLLIITPTPSDSKVSVEGQFPTTGTFSEELEPGSYDWTVSNEPDYEPKSGTIELTTEGKEISVELEEKPEILPPAPAKLVISVIPEDAKIEVSDHPEITEPGEYIVPAGSYTVILSKEGYESEKATPYLDEGGSETVSRILDPIKPPKPPEEITGKLIIDIEPPTAKVEISGYPEITNPGTYTLPTGNYDVKASLEGYISQTKTAFVREQPPAGVSFILEPVEKPPEVPKKVTLYITSQPTNADIYIDGEFEFTPTPFTKLVESGTYIVRVQKDGYYPQEASVTAGEGDEIEVPFVLPEIPEPEMPPVDYIPQEPYIPEYSPPEPYVPELTLTPYTEAPSYDYSKLYEPSFSVPKPEPVSPPTEKELLINIETTDRWEWEGRIYSIAFLDLSTPDSDIQVLVSDNEKTLINEFLGLFEAGGFTKLVGYNVQFDYRWLCNKSMLYRRPSKAFKEVELRDVYQLMTQMKEEFVYNASRRGTLNDFGKELLGKGKYGSQELILKKYISGDFKYVRAFQSRQIELCRDLYSLFRFFATEGSITHSSPAPAETSSPKPVESEEITKPQGQKQCPNCYAYNPASATTCEICGKSI